MDEKIVRSYARLACVETFAEGQPAGGDFKIGSLIDDTRTFSAQLQRYRGHMYCGGLHDDASHMGTSCEKDIIEALRQKLLIGLYAAGSYSDIIFRKNFAQNRTNDVSCDGRVFRRADDSAISCGDGACQYV